MPKSILMLDKIAKFVFSGLCILCFALNSCVKSSDPEHSGEQSRGILLPSDNIEFVENIPETVETDADDAEESDPISYDAEASSATKIINVLSVKDTYQHSNCDPSTNKYKDYTVAGGDGYQIVLTLSKADTIVSIVNPTGYYTMSIVPDESTTTQVTVVHTGTPKPDYKARNIKWVITFHNGKKTNLYMKTIPMFSGNLYGSAEYHVNLVRFATDPAKFNLNQHWVVNTPILPTWTPAQFDIFKYGSDSDAHYGIISNVPVQKLTTINGIKRQVWVFKVKERNAACTWKATTKTVKWFPGCRVPSANPSRDSAGLFYRSY